MYCGIRAVCDRAPSQLRVRVECENPAPLTPATRHPSVGLLRRSAPVSSTPAVPPHEAHKFTAHWTPPRHLRAGHTEDEVSVPAVSLTVLIGNLRMTSDGTAYAAPTTAVPMAKRHCPPRAMFQLLARAEIADPITASADTTILSSGRNSVFPTIPH